MTDAAPRWWVLPHDVLTQMLDRAHQGEDPGLLLVELDANSETERFDDRDDPPLS